MNANAMKLHIKIEERIGFTFVAIQCAFILLLLVSTIPMNYFVVGVVIADILLFVEWIAVAIIALGLSLNLNLV